MIRVSIVLVLSAVLAHAQPVPLEKWAEKLQTYYAASTPVKLHLQFNQPAYAPGDTAFFRVAYIVASENTPLKGFNLIELDVVDHGGRVVLHEVVRIRDGWAGNQLVLPADLTPGIYRVMAYDNWMKNFDRSRHFAGELHVSGDRVFSDAESAPTLTCFPEGGRLVTGLRSKVVVHGPARLEKGTVTDSKGNQVADFSTDKNGYGLFVLTPQAGVVYTVTMAGRSVQLTASDDGVGVLFTPSSSLNVPHRVVLQAPSVSRIREEALNVIISGHGNAYYSASFAFKDKEFVNLAIPAHLLPHGICYLTVNRHDGETLASRIFYSNRSVVKTTIKTDKREYGTRTDVKVDVSITDQENKPELARMSVSVYQADLFPHSIQDNWNIGNYFSWVSDLNQPPPDGFEGNLQTAEGLGMMDRMLITKTWPWYTWKQVLNDAPKPQFLFSDYQRITGRLVETPSGKPFADAVQITFFVIGTQDVYEVFSKEDGTFSVSFLFPFYRQEEIFYRVERAERRIDYVRIELTDSLNRYAPEPWVRTGTSDPYYNYSQKRGMVNTSFTYFSQASRRTPEATNRNAVLEKELVAPDITVDLDDYLIFPTMQETLHEIVPYLQYRKIAGRDVVRLYLPDKAQTGVENPAFIIDGVLIDDPAYFLKLKPVEVDKIKLVYSAFKLEKLGAISRNGIVFVETKIPDNAKNVSAAARLFRVNGITPAMPVPRDNTGWQKLNQRAPQLRSWLFWHPLIRSNENGEASFSFKTADDTGRYIIRVEGLTADGVPFVHLDYLEVNYTGGH